MNIFQRIGNAFNELLVNVRIGDTVATEVDNDLKGITDPASIARAAAASILKHEAELPAKWQGAKVVHILMAICQKVSGLDLNTVENIVNEALAAAQHPAAPQA